MDRFPHHYSGGGFTVKAKSAEAVVRIMVAKDPRQSADTILEFLMGVNGAAAAAVFSVEDEPRLFVGRGIAQSALDRTAECWKREGGSLAQGRLSRTDACLLLPVLRRERLVALVYLEAAHADLDSLAEVSGLLGDAIVRGSAQPEAASPVEAYLEETPTEEIERRRLILLLDRFEWNVARVARELRLTRTTVYKRLAAFAIPRKRVPKDPRGLRSLPTS
jgi:hypothetical protein